MKIPTIGYERQHFAKQEDLQKSKRNEYEQKTVTSNPAKLMDFAHYTDYQLIRRIDILDAVQEAEDLEELREIIKNTGDK